MYEFGMNILNTNMKTIQNYVIWIPTVLFIAKLKIFTKIFQMMLKKRNDTSNYEFYLCYLELLKPETMKLLQSTENKITKDKNGEHVPHFEITEIVLVHCNVVNNFFQQDSRTLYTFVWNKPFDSLLEISWKNHIFLRTFDSKFQAIEVWLIDQNISQPLEKEDRINSTLIIESYSHYKNEIFSWT